MNAARRLLAAGLAFLLSLAPVSATVGAQVHQIPAPVSSVEAHCSIGLAFDGANLYYDRCGDSRIYKVNPISGALVGVPIDTSVTELPNCLTYDPSRQGLWFGTQRCNSTGMPIYFLDLQNRLVTHVFTIPRTLTNPATGSRFLSFCFCDGLAFAANTVGDPSDDELWFSDDVNRNIGVFRPQDGILLRGYDATTIHPSLTSASGLAIGGPNLYLANDGGGAVFRANTSSNPLVLLDQFTSGDTRQEDMECDPVTFAPREVMWVRTTPQGGQFPDVMTAYEIESSTCSLGQVTPPPVQRSKVERLVATVGYEVAMTLITSGLIALACTVLTSGFCAPAILLILESLSLAIYAAEVTRIVLDPPDPNFVEIFVPRNYAPPVVQPGPDVPSTTAELANVTFAKLTDLYELVEAWRVTLERYQAAILAGDEVAAEVQLETLRTYILGTSPVALSSAQSLTTLLNLLESVSGPVPITEAQVDAGLADLAANGLPPLCHETLTNLGLSNQRINELVQGLLGAQHTAPPTLSAAVGSFAAANVVLSEVTACIQDSDCDDGDACTRDACTVETGCTHTVLDPGCANRPPVSNAGSDQIQECAGSGGAQVVLNGSASSDPDGDLLTCQWISPTCTLDDSSACVTAATCPLGSHTITLEVHDGSGGTASDTVGVRVQDTVYFLHGTGSNGNPTGLFMNNAAPTASTAKFMDSAAVRFSGGNAFKEIGTWSSTSITGTLSSLDDVDVWIGLKNSDDVGTRFDLRAELYKNGVLVAPGLTRCITNVARNPNAAKAASVGFDSFPPVTFNETDTLTLKILTRIGTKPNNQHCGGHSSATGLRMYFDSTSRASKLGDPCSP